MIPCACNDCPNSATNTENSPYMNDYCDECTYERHDLPRDKYLAETEYDEYYDESIADSVTCSGCGAVRNASLFNKPHSCHLNEDSVYEEGDVFL